MHQKLIITLILSLFCSLSIAKEGDITITGSSTVTGPLLSEIIGPLIQNFSVTTGCKSHTLNVVRQVLESPIGMGHHKVNKDSLLKTYSAKEKWQVSACGVVKPFYIDIGRDAYGALAFDISAKT